MEELKKDQVHKFAFVQRNQGLVSGVQDVKSFDEKEILLATSAGKMLIKGEKLHVQQLNLEKGEVQIEGRVDSVVYLSKNKEQDGQSMLRRMFR